MTPWTVVHQAPLSMGFPRQQYWSGLPSLSPADFPNPGIRLMSPVLAGGFFTAEPPGKPAHHVYCLLALVMLLLGRFNRVRLCATPETAAHQAPQSLGFSRQEHRSGLPFPSPGDLFNPGIELASPALVDGFFTAEPPGKPSKARAMSKSFQYPYT